MSLGQIHTGQEAVQYYTKGVQILLCMLEKHAQATAAASPLQDSGSEIPIARHVCVAYCSVAEIYFTDLW
ncbi:unnamed protein product [Oncorhynchus mykiss]|uniref:Uncharacterized protein n=1 Tax=Oncorhynchus mykiss TaxID=8022 RepID=A0A060Y4V4_ONCMY|nr:unnamed protein product [Oncorhynchus mykiss]